MRRTALLTAALGIALAACAVTPADAAPPPSELALTPAAACDAGKVCYRATVTPVSDAAGAADHYRFHITALGVAIDTVITATTFSFALPCSPGQSGTITADVWSIRRTKPSATSKHASTPFTCPDVAPPAPDSVIIAPVDSSQIAYLRLEPSTLSLTVGDSALVAAIIGDRAGRESPATDVVWSTQDTVAAIHPVPGTNKAWIIGLYPTEARSAGTLRILPRPTLSVGT